ncbi:hypothetical protein BDV38DRAFT_266688 [Aspergillus pseudotamarii]|uniref:Uncharacterized protein n=1 Tax=Aspergillus pseudotamarii TaxID=132259 RepID=A0A5N6S7M8_ASPPS|nr:uncharacterized protein BDV38DRAFT_266688 [Aspergillus pseudotamarii]KAE8130676.1 hypothetical protein BDV38DRAFT_266688 [Aspergillus pseudotamarii]
MVQENHQSLGSNSNLSNEINANDNNQADPTADPRSPAATAEYADYYREFLNELVDSIRNEDQAMVARIVGLIRSGASQDEVLGAIRSANS